MLLAIFIYWGWDTAVAVNEESEDAREAPGARPWSRRSSSLLDLRGRLHRGAGLRRARVPQRQLRRRAQRRSATRCSADRWNKLLIIAVLTSASASTQTTILPTARTTLSMARFKAIPELGRIHPRYLTPSVSTLADGRVSIVWYVGLTLITRERPRRLDHGARLQIAFYYGITGFACVDLLPP